MITRIRIYSQKVLSIGLREIVSFIYCSHINTNVCNSLYWYPGTCDGARMSGGSSTSWPEYTYTWSCCIILLFALVTGLVVSWTTTFCSLCMCPGCVRVSFALATGLVAWWKATFLTICTCSGCRILVGVPFALVTGLAACWTTRFWPVCMRSWSEIPMTGLAASWTATFDASDVGSWGVVVIRLTLSIQSG